MNENVKKQLGTPKNELEKDTLKYIEPLITEMIGEDIIGKKLTLKGCLESCFKKGKKFEVRDGSHGVAMITPEQHFAWVREYFGIGEAPDPTAPAPTPAPAPAPKDGAVNLDFDSLFD